MASTRQIRGALLEEIVLLLLARSGYRKVQAGEEGTRSGPAGLEVEGRGTRHQIDALVTPIHSHAFIYPIRLMVEAKCETNPVGLATARSVVGTLHDINQNYFVRRLPRGQEIHVQRFNYHAALFAANGYSGSTERYALAHQVYLIDYSNVPVMRPVIDSLFSLEAEDFGEWSRERRWGNLTRAREAFRASLEELHLDVAPGVFSDIGGAKVRDSLLPALGQLRGSYYGMIEGIYPVHLVSRTEIPIHLIREQHDIMCEIRVSDDETTWAFEPSEIPRNSPEFFRLEFSLPESIAEFLNARSEERRERQDIPRWLHIANLKAEHIRFVDVTTVQGEQLVPFRLVLDTNWLNRYVEGRQARLARRTDRREPQS